MTFLDAYVQAIAQPLSLTEWMGVVVIAAVLTVWGLWKYIFA